MCAAVQTSFVLEHVAAGGGRHAYYLSREQNTAQIKWSVLEQIPFIVATTLTKVSICLMIIHITNNKKLVRFLGVLVFLLASINAACLVGLLTQCRPLVAFWDYSVKGQCWNHSTLVVFDWLQGGKFDSQTKLSVQRLISECRLFNLN